MARIFWDTNLFIYLLEDWASLGEQTAEVRRRMIDRGDKLYTSALTVGEILVRPVAAGSSEVEAHYRAFFRRPGIVVLPFDEAAAPHYARIRQDRGIQKPDALQLACAATVGIDLFLTNDERLSRKAVPGIQFITGLTRAPI